MTEVQQAARDSYELPALAQEGPVPEPEPQWYKQTRGIFGNQRANYLASAIYVVLVGTPFILFLACHDEFLKGVKASPCLLYTSDAADE